MDSSQIDKDIERQRESLIENLSLTERIVYETLEQQWEHVGRCTAAHITWPDQREKGVREQLTDEIRKDQQPSNRIDELSELCESGIPDLLAFNKGSYAFYEVKSGNGSLNKNQLEWLCKFPGVKTSIVYVDKRDRLIEDVFFVKDISIESAKSMIRNLDSRLHFSVARGDV